jgi:hypothetical protein
MVDEAKSRVGGRRPGEGVERERGPGASGERETGPGVGRDRIPA